MRDFADTPTGWYQERVCGILASLSLLIEADERMKLRGGSLGWIYKREMEHHFERAVFDTLRLLQLLTHGRRDIATSANLKALLENGYSAFINIIDAHEDEFDLEPWE